MYEINFRHWLWQLPLVISASLINLSSHPATAQITPDSTLGSESSIVTPNINVKGSPADLINGGAIRNTNLFHSFSEFNVGEGQRVYFANPTGIDNILTRVTGSNASNILGLLGVNGTANLFLINPNGIIFGPNSRLDIPGSFFATTANSLIFSNGTEFSATNPQAPPLLTISVPSGIQFNNSQPAPIVSQGKLEVGQNFTLAAGNLDLSGQLQAGGNLTLQATDTVRIRDTVTEPFVARSGGNMYIQGNQSIDILALNHLQTPFESGGNLTLVSNGNISGDAHFTSAGNFSILNLSGQPGNFVSLYDPIIKANGDVDFGNYTGVALKVEATGSITGGNVTITGADTSATGDPDSAILTDTAQNGALILYAGLNSVTPLNFPSFGVPTLGTNFTTPATSLLPVGSIKIGDINTNTALNAMIGGKVILQAAGNITTGQIQSQSTAALLGSGGSVNLQAAGNITTGQIQSQSTAAFVGDGGLVNLQAAGNITTGQIQSQSTAALLGSGGSVNLQAAGNITTDKIDSSAISIVAGSGGAITIISKNGTIALENSQIISNTNSGKGGDITLQARAVELNNGSAIIAGTTGSGEGGKISISADSVNINGTGNNSSILKDFLGNGIPPSNISSLKDGIFAVTAGDGKAGDLNIDTKQLILQNQAVVFALTLGNGQGGNLNVNAPEGSIKVIDSGLFAATSGTGNAGNAGNFKISASNIEITGNSPATKTGFVSVTLGTGSTGLFTVETQNLNIQNWAGISTETRGSGSVNDLTINADKIFLNGNKLTESGVLSSTRGTANGGNVIINAVDIELKNGGTLNSQTRGAGNAGNLTINTRRFTAQGDDTGAITGATESSTGKGGNLILKASEFVQLIGDEPGAFSPTIEWARSEFGAPNSLNNNANNKTGLSTGTRGTVDAGDLTIITGKLVIQDGAGITTSTLGEGQGGNLTVIADTVEMQGKTLLATATFGNGNAGNLKINTGELTIQDGGFVSADAVGNGNAGDLEIATRQLTVQNGSRIGVSTGSAGNAGNLNINASEFVEVAGKSNNGQTASGLFAQGETGSTGKAGDLTIATGKLIIRDGGQVTVSNQGLGDAGNINIKSDTVLMSNQGQIVAATASGEGGNINLQLGSLLLMRHNSQISTTAGNNGNGGNININAPFIVGVPKENSDITANAFLGSGGRIQITTQGIFGLKFRPRLTPKSDITASSDFGVNGVVQITTLGIDPSQGLNSLPTNFQPPKVAEGCQVYGKRATNPLITTGSGGMPLNPRDVLSSNGVLDDLGSPVNQMATTTITEAQGMTRNAEGQMVLVAPIRTSCLSPNRILENANPYQLIY